MGRQAQAALRGTLVEADFERSAARLPTADGSVVSVSFSPDLADDIEEALRQPAEFVGEVTCDATTSTATAIRLRGGARLPQPLGRFESEDYWRPQSLAALERAGILQPVESPEDLRAPGSVDGEDLGAFFAAITG